MAHNSSQHGLQTDLKNGEDLHLKFSHQLTYDMAQPVPNLIYSQKEHPTRYPSCCSTRHQTHDLMTTLLGLDVGLLKHKQPVYAIQRDQMKVSITYHPMAFYDAI